MIEEISDHKAQSKLKNAIAQRPKLIPLLRSFFYCGSKTIKQTGTQSAVFVLANEVKSKFFGLTSCKNSWGCPVCSARTMAKYSTEIACAIEALKQPPHNQLAFMITFTVPHTSTMSCEQVTNVLFDTWKDFTNHGNKNQQAKYYANEENKYKHGQKKSMKISKKKLNDPFASFCETFNCKHRVRVGEFTWGPEHGWHPHFHCLFWVDKNKLQSVKQWEDILMKRWLELAKKNFIKQWDKVVVGNKNGKVGVGLSKTAEVPEAIRKGVDDAKKNNRIRAQIMFDNLNDVSKAVYISADEKGHVIEQKSSSYICGWGADRELTGNYADKATHEGHLTPRQILEKATSDPNDKFMNLYIEYLVTLRLKKRRRIMFSTNSGIKAIIRKYKCTKSYQEVYKKKATTSPYSGLKVVCWFTELQWSQICWLETHDVKNIKAKILQLARLYCANDEITDYLYRLGIDITKNPMKHHLQSHIESMFAPDAA